MKKVYLFSFVCFLSVSAACQVSWTKNPDPVLEKGPGGSWDDSWIGMPCVLLIDDTLRMWYTGAPDNSTMSVGYATSTDGGMNWTKYDKNPVLEYGPQGSWEEKYVYFSKVLYHESSFHMWYIGANSNGIESIGYATSPDGIHWTKYEGNPIDTYSRMDPGGVLFKDNLFHMWYGYYTDGTYKIGKAISEDGISWTKNEGNPIINPGPSGSWDHPRVQAHSVIYDGQKFHLWYSGGGFNTWQEGYAFSADGINWTKYKDNPVLTKGPPGSLDNTFVFFSSVLFDSINSMFQMWYHAGTGGIGYAESPVIINIPDDYPTIQAGIDAASDGDLVLVAEDTYYENIRFKGKAITVASHFILDGDPSHISKTIINGSQPAKEDSASVVLFGDGEDSTSVLCGLTITGGKGTRYTNEVYGVHKVGLGIYIDEGCGGKIEHCIIEENHLENDMQQWGGGICIMLHNKGDTSLERSVIIQENIIRNNSLTTSVETGNSGGGIKVGTGAMKYGRLIIQNNIIESNIVTNNNSKGWAIGGGINIGMSIPTPQGEYCIRNNIFAHNKVQGPGAAWGGGIYSNHLNFGTSYFNDTVPAPFYYNNLIYKNEAHRGGGIAAEITIVNNSTNFQTVPQAVFANNTIVDNKASVGAGLYSSWSISIFINNIFRNNLSTTGKEIVETGNVSIYAYNNWISDCFTPAEDHGNGNLCGDPQLTEDYYLSDSSGCVGYGLDSILVKNVWYHIPPFDFNESVRPHHTDDFVDMGAFESPYKRSTVGIEHSFESKDLSISPNPTIGSLIIKKQKQGLCSIELYSLGGQLLLSDQMTGNTMEIDLSSFQKGIYFITIRSKDFVRTEKIIKL